MSETSDELLAKVEDALWFGDQRAASILLHKVLLQDFTNRQAWLLLHSIRGGSQSLEDFQQDFANKYYPQLADLLEQSHVEAVPQTSPEEEPVIEEESLIVPVTLSPDVKPLFDVPEPRVTTGSATPATPAPEPTPLGTAAPLVKPEPPQTAPPAPLTWPQPFSETGESRSNESEALSSSLEAPAEIAEEQVIENELFPPEPPRLEVSTHTAMRTIFCPECGKKLKGHEKFCGQCGTNLNEVLPPIPPEPAQIPPVNNPVCPACGSNLAVGSQYCDVCGVALFPPIEIPIFDTQPQVAIQDVAVQPVIAQVPPRPQPSARQSSPIPAPQQPSAPHSIPTPPKDTAPRMPAEKVTVLLWRKDWQTSSTKKFKIWIDGKLFSQIGNRQEICITLPAGKHIFMLEWRGRYSKPFEVELSPGQEVYTKCHLAGIDGQAIPEMAIIPKRAPQLEQTEQKNPGCWSMTWIIIGSIIFLIVSTVGYLIVAGIEGVGLSIILEKLFGN